MAKKTGGCLCGAVRYETTETPARVMACHCTTCKQRTGSVYGVGVYFPEDQITFTAGELASYEFNSDTTGRWIKTEFCRSCGSTVTWKTEMRPGWRAVAGGSYDDPHWYSIEAHIWTRSARKDMCYQDDMPVHSKGITQATT